MSTPTTPHPLTAASADAQTDALLVALAVDGDRDALDRLVRRHQP